MGRLFGPDTSKKKFKLTEHEKLLLKEGAEYAGAGLLIYGGYKFAKKAGVNYLTKKNLENLGIKNATALQKAFSESVFKDAKTFINPFSLSTKEVNLSAGTVIKRLSTVKETTVKETGFFAAYKPEDIERYKAVLPIYWKSWALNPELGVELKADGSGYITHIISDRAIKAPSEKEAYNLYKQYFKLSHFEAAKTYKEFSQNWILDKEENTKFFDFVKSKGYNALIDSNDSGKYSDSPLRIIDSKGFKVVKNEVLSAKKIKQAQQNFIALQHALKNEETMDNLENFLEHHGVKGQKWGIRNKKTYPKSKNEKELARLLDRPVHNLSNSDLKKIQERNNLINEYKKAKPSKHEKGIKFAKKTLETAGVVGSLYALSKTPLAKDSIKLGQKFISNRT